MLLFLKILFSPIFLPCRFLSTTCNGRGEVSSIVIHPVAINAILAYKRIEFTARSYSLRFQTSLNVSEGLRLR